MLRRNQTMKQRNDKNQLSNVMKKALTQVGAFFVKQKTVYFAQESQSVLRQESLSGISRNQCPVNLQCRPLKGLLNQACRAFLVRADLNLKSNMKTSIGIQLKIASGILHQINNSEGWYQNVLFGGKVPKPH